MTKPKHPDVDFNAIIDNLDDDRAGALRAYLIALRERAAHDLTAFDGDDAAIDAAKAAVIRTFDQLIAAQRRLLQPVPDSTVTNSGNATMTKHKDVVDIELVIDLLDKPFADAIRKWFCAVRDATWALGITFSEMSYDELSDQQRAYVDYLDAREREAFKRLIAARDDSTESVEHPKG